MLASRWLLVALPLLVANCASITEGPSQTITVNTTPPGATCRLYNRGVLLGTVATTPGAVFVKRKNDSDIRVICESPGFQTATYVNKSDTAAATLGNILVGGIAGVFYDQSTGAAYKYEGTVNITLNPAHAPAPPVGVPQI